MLRKIIVFPFALLLYLFVLPFKINEIRNNKGIISIYSHFPSRKLFRRLINWFLKRNYEFVSTDELISIIKNKKKIKNKVWLSFDDGLKTNINDILPVLEKYKIPATFFVAPNLYKQNNRFVTKNEIKIINKCKFVSIGNHTFNHKSVNQLSIKEINHELSKCNLELRIQQL